MRLSRIHTDQPLSPGALVDLSGAAVTYLTRVLRLAPGAPLILFDGRGGEYAATFESATRERVRCRLGTFSAVERESALHITVLQGIARGDRMDTIVQKCTELGVTRIIPLASERSVVRTSGATADRKRLHWRGVAISACEQCGRNRIPDIDPPLATDAALVAAQSSVVRLMLDPDVPFTLTERASSLRAQESIALLIGPEGGLSDAERALAAHAGFEACRLGPRVLRTETAALAAISVLQAIAGDFRRP